MTEAPKTNCICLTQVNGCIAHIYLQEGTLYLDYWDGNPSAYETMTITQNPIAITAITNGIKNLRDYVSNLERQVRELESELAEHQHWEDEE